MIKKFLKCKYIVIVIIASLIAGKSLLPGKLYPTHDGEYHIIRFYEFDKVLRSGIWYPRWAPDLNNGYGVPLFNFVYPFPNYIASLFHLFGASFIHAFTLSMFAATTLGGTFFYLWSKRYWDSLGGVISAICYLYSPYRFLDVYIRGSIGEVWAIALLPVLLWSTDKLFATNEGNYLAVSSLILALIIFSHNILGLMFFVFYVSYLGIQFAINKQINNKKSVILVPITALGLSSIFWLPALAEKQFVTGLEIYRVKDYFPELYQLLIPSWGSGFSGGDLQNQMSYQIGIANIFGFVASIILLVKTRKKNKAFMYIVFFQFWFIFSFFLMLRASQKIWEIIPFMNYFQFPWRFLNLSIISASFLSGSISCFWQEFSNRIQLTITLIICTIIILLSISYTIPAYFFNRNDAYYTSRPNFIDGTNSPGNLFNTIWFENGIYNKTGDVVNITPPGATIKNIQKKPTRLSFQLFSKNNATIIAHIAYFPGWTAYIDNTNFKTVNEDGLVSLSVPKGDHEVTIIYRNTEIRSISELLALFSLIILALSVFKLNASPKHKNN